MAFSGISGHKLPTEEASGRRSTQGRRNRGARGGGGLRPKKKNFDEGAKPPNMGLKMADNLLEGSKYIYYHSV